MNETLRERIAAEIFAAEDEDAESGYYPLAEQPDETREMYLQRADRILALLAPADAALEREPDAEDIARRFRDPEEAKLKCGNCGAYHGPLVAYTIDRLVDVAIACIREGVPDEVVRKRMQEAVAW